MIDTTRPKLELLSRAFIEQIVDEALTLLERHGILVENAEALGLLAGAGADVDLGSEQARIGRKLVRDCLATTPSVIRRLMRRLCSGPSDRRSSVAMIRSHDM